MRHCGQADNVLDLSLAQAHTESPLQQNQMDKEGTQPDGPKVVRCHASHFTSLWVTGNGN